MGRKKTPYVEEIALQEELGGFPSSQRRGGRAINKNGSVPKWRGRGGAKREPDRAKPQLMVSSAKLFRPEDFAGLTTITASRYRARASRPSAPLWWLRSIFLLAQPSLLCEEGNASLSSTLGRLA